jgi:hypothetical protein
MISITTIKKRLANSSKNCRLSAGQINFFKAIGANHSTKYFGTRGRSYGTTSARRRFLHAQQ